MSHAAFKYGERNQTGSLLSNAHRRITSNDLFFAAYGLWLFTMMINTTLYAQFLVGGMFALIRYGCLGMLLLSLTMSFKSTWKTLLGLAIAGAVVLCALHSADTVLVDCVLFILCSRNKNFDDIARLSLGIVSCTLVFVIASAFLGVIPNYSAWAGGRQRLFLGFRYTLYPADFMFVVTCLTVYLRGSKLTIRRAAILLMGNVLINYYTTSRLSYYLSLFVLFGALFFSKTPLHLNEGSKHHDRAIRIACTSAFILMAALSFTLVFLYTSGNRQVALLDSVRYLGGRLSIAARAFRTYRINLFGREIHFFGAAIGANGDAATYEEYNYIDNLFVKSLLNYGLVFLSIYLMLTTAIMHRAYEQRNSYLVLILLAIAIHCTIDNAMLYLFYNPFLLLIGKLMEKRQSRDAKGS